MPTAYLTRIVEFSATHRFPDTPEFAGATDDHSHRYRCAVTVKGVFDPARGGMTPTALIPHLNTDLVLWAWFPGVDLNGVARRPPPLRHDEFTALAKKWVSMGASCPP